MEKKIAGLLGAVALGTLTTVQAAPAPAPVPADPMRANSYADLLEPIPNAAAVLKVVDEQTPAASEGKVQLAQNHHHHHNHHSHWRRRPVVVIGRHRHHHHHHHHHHHQ